MPNSILILKKTFKFKGNPISRSLHKISVVSLSSEKNTLCHNVLQYVIINYVVTRDVCPSVRL